MASDIGMNPTTKQFGDACEHYIVSRLSFANIPATKMPDCWPGHDVVAQRNGKSLRISVKGRRIPVVHRNVLIDMDGGWDWLAAIFYYTETKQIRSWLLPRSVAEKMSQSAGLKNPRRRQITLCKLIKHGAKWEDNFDIH